jgi:hypothetical protein
MGPFRAQSFIIIVIVVHNIAIEWQLELLPQI